jgi:hypothetical protein
MPLIAASDPIHEDAVKSTPSAVILVLASAVLVSGAEKRVHHDGEIRTTYDETSKTTNVALLPMAVPGTGIVDAVGPDTATIHIMAGFNLPGRTPQGTPSEVEFYVLVRSADAEPGGAALTLLAELDKQQSALGSMRIIRNRASRVVGAALGDRYREYALYTALRPADFSRLAHAQKAQLQIAHQKFELGRNILEALRDLESRTVLTTP